MIFPQLSNRRRKAHKNCHGYEMYVCNLQIELIINIYEPQSNNPTPNFIPHPKIKVKEKELKDKWLHLNSNGQERNDR